MSDLAILMVTCDEYSDLWDDFFNLIDVYWKDMPYKFYMANNEKAYTYKDMTVINCGKNTVWSKRMQTALNQITEKYVCVLLEDYFISDFVNNELVRQAEEIIKKDGLKYYKLSTFSPIKTELYDGYCYLRKIPQDLEYGISLQAAIWDREFLLDLVGEEEYNAWKFESMYYSGATDKVDYEKCVFDSRDLLKICHVVTQGRILNKAIKMMRKKGYEIDTKKRAVMPLANEFILATKGCAQTFIKGKLRMKIKKILRKFGVKFVSDMNK